MKQTKFLILFTGRSGGTLLQRSLNNHPNIICDGEILQEKTIGEQLDTLNWMYSRFSDEIQAVGLKTKLLEVRARHYPAFLNYLNSNHVKVIHLYRENPLKHALSHYIGNRLYDKTKAWEIYDLKDRITPVPVDWEEFCRALYYVQEFERRNFWFVQHLRSKIQISYEQWTENKESILKLLQEWLEIPYREGILEPMEKVTPDNLREAISNYDEFGKWIYNLSPLPGERDRPYFMYLDDKVSILEEVVEDDPQSLQAIIELVWLLIQAKEYYKASQYIEKANQIDNEGQELREVTGYFLQLLLRLPADSDQDLELLISVAHEMINRNDIQNAKLLIDKINAIDNTSWNVLEVTNEFLTQSLTIHR